MLFDLGVSSLQLDDPARGFAYAQDAPLDMRMDQTTGATAAEVLNTYPAGHWPGCCGTTARSASPAGSPTRSSASASRSRSPAPPGWSSWSATSIPAATRRTGGHPAKRTFQALRIEVNGELDALRAALPGAVDALAVGGRIAVLAYHSLEDRLVKQVLAAGARGHHAAGPAGARESAQPRLRLLTRGAQRPTAAEVAANPRAARPGSGPPSASGTPRDRRHGDAWAFGAAPSNTRDRAPETEHQKPERRSTEHHGAGPSYPAARGTRE